MTQPDLPLPGESFDPVYTWGAVLEPPSETSNALVVDLDLERGPPATFTAVRVKGDQIEETLHVARKGRLLVITRDGGEISNASPFEGFGVKVRAEGLQPNVARIRWSSAEDPNVEPIRLSTPSVQQVFDQRRADAEAELEAVKGAGTDDERWDACFRIFLEEWDRETYTSEEESKLWTDVVSSTPLCEDKREQRRNAILSLSASLEVCARKRGHGKRPPNVDADHLDLIAELHGLLFDKLETNFGSLPVDRLSRSFIRFAAAQYRSITRVATGEKQEPAYLNATPNSASMLVCLPELVQRASERPAARPTWCQILPGVVAGLAAYGSTHTMSPDLTLRSYALHSCCQSSSLSAKSIDAVGDRFKDYERSGKLESHWQNTLCKLAPRTFYPATKDFVDFPKIADYVHEIGPI
ncbi:MAG: hypothetical protein AAGB93_08150 [Planctomycetota bacterium]